MNRIIVNADCSVELEFEGQRIHISKEQWPGLFDCVMRADAQWQEFAPGEREFRRRVAADASEFQVWAP